MFRAEYTVCGRGVAGLQTARHLAAAGKEVVLVEPRHGRDPRTWYVLGHKLPQDVQEGIQCRSAKYVVSGTEFIIFDQDQIVSRYGISLPGKVETSWMIQQQQLENYLNTSAQEAGVKFVHDGVVSATTQSDLVVNLKSGEQIETEALVDATGPYSHVLRSVEPDPLLDDDPYVMWIFGGRMHGEFDPDTMLFPLSSISGRLAWVTPWSNSEADIVSGDYCRLSQYKTKMPEFRRKFEYLLEIGQKNRLFKINERIQGIAGKIRLAPIKRPTYRTPVYAVGEAAGQACPNVAEGVPPALTYGELLAKKLIEVPNYSPADYHSDWRKGDKAQIPYDLSLLFMRQREQDPNPGGNKVLYECIMSLPAQDQMRIMSERKIDAFDLIHSMLKVGISPGLSTKIFSLASDFVNLKLGRYERFIYGNTNK